jgi:hypothetical protein
VGDEESPRWSDARTPLRIIPFGGGIDFFRLGACTPNPLGDLRHHNPNPSEPPNDERRKSWPYLESRTLMFITE